MICTKCGSAVNEGSAFCTACGQPVETPVQAPRQPVTETQQPAAAPPAAQEAIYPSIAFLTCTGCGGSDLAILGQKGGLGKSIGMTFALGGAIGGLVAGANAAKDTATYPIQYKCRSCGVKFESGPLVAKPDEVLSAPATVNFTRKGSFVGAAVPQIVYLNGMKMGPVKNGKTITFQTMVRYNILFATDQFGVAFKDTYRFETQAGGTVDVKFKRKFIQ